MSCWQTIQDYAFRSIGFGERLLPREDFTLCQQFTLIGSGMIWNIYFGVLALILGFFLATAVALGKASHRTLLRKPSEWFIFVFRGSPLFIQFFFGYFLFLNLKSVSPFFDPFFSCVAWRADCSLSQYRRLFRRNILRRPAVHSKRRHRSRGRVRSERMDTIQTGDLAHHVASGLACLHKRGDLSFSSHRACVLFRLSCLAAKGRRALLRELFRRQNLQSIRALPDPCVLLHPADAGHRGRIRVGQPASESPFTAGFETENEVASEPDPVVSNF